MMVRFFLNGEEIAAYSHNRLDVLPRRAESIIIYERAYVVRDVVHLPQSHEVHLHLEKQ